MKFFAAIFFLFCFNLFAQETDTTSTDTFIGDTITVTDTIIADTTGIFTPQPDTLYPINQTPLYDYSTFVSRRMIDILNYKYTGDIFLPLSFSFLKDKGMIGQANELILYGNNSTGYLVNGILHNNRYRKFLDLNLIQSESIDSVEVLPIPRGFLYGNDNYLTSVNFIEKDFITTVPYTRIKYYEGPDGEAFVDGIFNTAFLKRFNFYFDITNRNFDGVYDNSDFSIWQANVKLKYFLSNSINLIGSYSLVDSETGFFGGTDVDSISKITNDINSVLFDPLFAPVINPDLRQHYEWDKFNLKGLVSLNNFKTDFNLYYHAERERYSGIPSKDEIKNYVSGASLRKSYSHPNIKLEVLASFEKRDLNYYRTDTISGFNNLEAEYNLFSVSPVISIYLLDSIIVPSIFYKYSKLTDYNSQNGLGADITINLFRWINLYTGFSKFDFINEYETTVYEVGGKIKLSNLNADIRFYSINKLLTSFMPSPHISFLFIDEPRIKNITGYSAGLNYDVWKIGFEGRINYNLLEGEPEALSPQIKMHANGGVFYKDILFNNNLNLKTGFAFKFFDFESDDFNSAYQIDFTAAGIIQQTAIVYFSWENLLGEEYFIVPYYPMRERGVRFGLAWELFN